MIMLIMVGMVQVGGAQQQGGFVKVLLAEKSEASGAITRIVALGDSLTAGYGVAEADSYPYLLEQRLHRAGFDCRVINAGVSGETSSGTLARIKWVIMSLAPDIVILETGANDGFRGIKTELVEGNIRQIIEILHRNDVVVLLAGMKMVTNLGSSYVSEFDAIYPRIANDFGLVFMPFFLQGVAMNPELNIADGIHPNNMGYTKITENIYPYVVEAIAKSKSNER